MDVSSETVNRLPEPPDATDDEIEAIRRRFAEAWGQMGASWGVAPSTAAVQGYLLAHGGPVTDAELQQALGLSHRAIRLALASCIDWGIVQRAEEPRRSGRRGPAGRAWVALDDHWEWFRRVIEGRKEREGDPVIALLEQCLVEVRQLDRDAEAERLEHRLESLLSFVREFDHALTGVLRADTAALRNMFAVLSRLTTPISTASWERWRRCHRTSSRTPRCNSVTCHQLRSGACCSSLGIQLSDGYFAADGPPAKSDPRGSRWLRITSPPWSAISRSARAYSLIWTLATRMKLPSFDAEPGRRVAPRILARPTKTPRMRGATPPRHRPTSVS